MKISALLLTATLLSACGGDRVLSPPEVEDQDVDPLGPATLGEAEVKQDDGVTQATPYTCAGYGEHDFRMWAQGLTAWEGHRVVAAAIENELGGGARTSTRPVHIAGTIRGGAFSLACARSLHTNYGYPSYAVYVDVDGDGRCGPGDVAHQSQRYGWDDAMLVEIPNAIDFAGWITIPPAGTSGNLQAPIGGRGATFCAAYFD
jgi:hypothetical protein